MPRMMGRRMVRAAATTAVVAGTAGAVHHHQDQKYANQAAAQQQQYAEPAPAEPQVVYVQAPPPQLPLRKQRQLLPLRLRYRWTTRLPSSRSWLSYRKPAS